MAKLTLSFARYSVILETAMTTLSVTEARQNLGAWIKKAIAGENVGILCGSKVVALRPVEVESTDYAAREYGVSGPELDRFVKRVHEEIKKDRKTGKLREFTGDIEALVQG
jgi:antitoxin (DNA-binding transcriptional repressor) of toxin-antitoxin stability system